MKWRKVREHKKLSPETIVDEKACPKDLTFPPRRIAYRDWGRRCRFLNKLIAENKFDKDRLLDYKKKNLYRMLDWLTSSKHTLGNKLVRHLREHLLLRRRLNKKLKECKSTLVIEWKNNSLRRIGLRSLLHNVDLRSCLPAGFENCLNDVVICNRLIPPISNQIYNYKETAKLLEGIPDNLDNCPCCAYAKEFRPNEGCVWTGNLAILGNDCLRKLISYGQTFAKRLLQNHCVFLSRM